MRRKVAGDLRSEESELREKPGREMMELKAETTDCRVGDGDEAQSLKFSR